jgi:YidC/Oxa1 family membrane protein insertase
MELYRKAGVSPVAGCVPMLLQMPVLYAMFRFFPSEHRVAPAALPLGR